MAKKPKRRINEFTQERKDYAKSHSIAEKEILPFVRRALRDTVAPVIKHIELYGFTNLIPEAIINRSVWREMYPKIYQKLGMKFAKKEFYRQRGLEAQKASAIDFLIDVWSSMLRNYAFSHINLMENELNETTIRIIKEALGDSYLLGVDRDNAVRLFIKDIQGRFRKRAGTISRTEATTISNLGKDIGARSWIDQQGGQGYKVWLGRNDIKERPSHIQENNTILPIDDEFDLSGQLAQRPGDVNLSASQRINCRCVCSYMSENRYNGYLRRNRIVDGKLLGAS